VFVQNLAPGAVDRLGLPATALAARHPRLIVCGISGYGTSGPWADRRAYDLLVQCETGLVSINGTPQGMARVGISVADIAAGMYAFSGILAALYQRAVTGTAAAVEVSLFEALTEWLGQPLYATMYGGRPLARVGIAHPAIAPYGPYQTGDGGTVLLAVQNDRDWTRFCDVFLGAPQVATDPRFIDNSARVANQVALDAIIGQRLGTLDTASTLSLLEDAGLANARLNAIDELVDHPVLAERDRWRHVATPAGPVRALLPPTTPGGAEPRMDGVPALGEHTDAILHELGHSEGGIRSLRASGVV
jgi:formyl-CoA transferase